MATALEKIQRKLDQLESGGDLFWKAKVGGNEIRVGPAKDKDGLFYKEVQVHYGQGPEHNRVILCREDKKCQPCKRVKKLANSSSSKKQKRAERQMAKTSIAMNIYDLKKKPGKFQLWQTTNNNLQELLGYYVDTDIGDFTHPKRGYNVVVRRKGEKLKTRYKIRLKDSPSKLKGWKKLKKSLIDLDTWFKKPSVKQQRRIMSGEDSRDNDRE